MTQLRETMKMSKPGFSPMPEYADLLLCFSGTAAWMNSERPDYVFDGKGVCLNLGLKGLYEPTAKITEMLRNSKYEEAEQMMEDLEAEYKCHCENLSALKEA